MSSTPICEGKGRWFGSSIRISFYWYSQYLCVHIVLCSDVSIATCTGALHTTSLSTGYREVPLQVLLMYILGSLQGGTGALHTQ
jgi:hypothetical protein